MELLIEPADVSNAQELLDLQKLAYKGEAAIYNDYSIPPLTQTLDQMRTDFQKQVVLRATLDGRIVGSVRGYAEGGTCYIGRLIVHPAFQNRGIGARLMAEIERRFGEASRYELFTGDRSERNLYLYQKLGYHIFRHERQTAKVTLVYMEKRANCD